jgi:hypothetical protein
MNTDNLATDYHWLTVAAIVFALSLAVAGVAFRIDTLMVRAATSEKPKSARANRVLNWVLGAAALSGTVALIGAIVAGASLGATDDSKDSIVSFMDQTYGLQLTDGEADRVYKSAVRKTHEDAVLTVGYGAGVRMVTFDVRFGELRAYTEGTESELPRLK